LIRKNKNMICRALVAALRMNAAILLRH